MTDGTFIWTFDGVVNAAILGLFLSGMVILGVIIAADAAWRWIKPRLPWGRDDGGGA